jgi:hypothetical protein
MKPRFPGTKLLRLTLGANAKLLGALLIVLVRVETLRGAEPVYLSDCPERILTASQGWGSLGWDVAAHLGDRAGEALRIGDKSYAKGLGSHANGSLQVLLDGEYDVFQAEVGLQPCSGGSVIFRVRVDGEVHFESGVLRSGEAAKTVELLVQGAQELVLEASDARPRPTPASPNPG